jgi:hypothetical protein
MFLGLRGPSYRPHPATAPHGFEDVVYRTITGEAIGRALGWAPEAFVSTSNENRKEATMTEVGDSPLANALLKIAGIVPTWSSSPATLHAKLTELVGPKFAASARWPMTNHTFGNELRRLAPQLCLHGLFISFERRNRGRVVTFQWEGGQQASHGAVPESRRRSRR